MDDVREVGYFQRPGSPGEDKFSGRAIAVKFRRARPCFIGLRLLQRHFDQFLVPMLGD